MQVARKANLQDKEVRGTGQYMLAGSATGAHKDCGHLFFNRCCCQAVNLNLEPSELSVDSHKSLASY